MYIYIYMVQKQATMWHVQPMEKLQIRHMLDVSGFPGH